MKRLSITTHGAYRVRASQGFTLVEVLIVLALIGIVAAIAAPSWLSFSERRQLSTVRDQIYSSIRQAQSEARNTRKPHRLNIREQDGIVEWSIHSGSELADTANWEKALSKSVRIDDETTFVSSDEIYYVRFDEKGNPHRLGRFTLSGERFSKNKECVVVSTLIGAVRKSRDQPDPDPTYRRKDRFCY